MNERLYRSRSDRMLAGVAGGLAELWDVDPSIVRLVWALLVILTGGLALLIYLIMAIVVPDEDDAFASSTAGAAAAGGAAAPAEPLVTPPPAPGAQWAAPPVDARRAARMEAKAARRAARAERQANGGGLTGAMIAGIVLVALGGFFLVREWLPQFDFDWFWPAMLIVLGVLVLVAALGRTGPRDPGTPS